jgi:hypothetical protein
MNSHLTVFQPAATARSDTRAGFYPVAKMTQRFGNLFGIVRARACKKLFSFANVWLRHVVVAACTGGL